MEVYTGMHTYTGVISPLYGDKPGRLITCHWVTDTLSKSTQNRNPR